MNANQQLQHDVESLRANFTDTQDLYREVCAMMFFRHGITPTANRLYQLVRKGSMSAPAAALAQFWEDLREKSRVRIEHPDLPDALQATAGELLAALWREALSNANESLAMFRADMTEALKEAQAVSVEHQLMAKQAEAESEQVKDALQSLQREYDVLEEQLMAEQSAKLSLNARLVEIQAQRDELSASLERARLDFAAELEKVHQAQLLAEMRYTDLERHALLDMDRERTTSAKTKKELENLSQSMTKQLDHLRKENIKLLEQLAEQGRNLGKFEGALGEARASYLHLQNELVLCKQHLIEREANLVALQAENIRLKAPARNKQQTGSTNKPKRTPKTKDNPPDLSGRKK
ncbi:DNA-binding protein [Chitinivorax sp. B]|uniref:DNA-binding protein n=1 Tax=Chitinivorax sp. B TaxID=2502235 RepID=UPI0010F64747|nr:DNA-binding protein [Chitinivorax sp. B]